MLRSMKTQVLNGVTISLGQNAVENWKLVSDFRTTEFLWFHLDSFPSGHAVVQCPKPTPDLIQEAARWVIAQSKYRNLPNVKVCYTSCSNLIKGHQVGAVTFKSNRKVKTI